jgi:hypothetical protein
MRRPDWPQRLDTVIAEKMAARFEYGVFDCMLLLADCVLAMTDVDYAKELRGYDSKVAAYRIVAHYGSLEAMITALLGRGPIHPSQAMRGDVVLAGIELAPGESGECGGVCCGTHCAFPKDPKDVGLRFLPRSVARLAWRID